MSELTCLELGLVERGPVQNRKVESVLKEYNATPLIMGQVVMPKIIGWFGVASQAVSSQSAGQRLASPPWLF